VHFDWNSPNRGVSCPNGPLPGHLDIGGGQGGSNWSPPRGPPLPNRVQGCHPAGAGTVDRRQGPWRCIFSIHDSVCRSVRSKKSRLSAGAITEFGSCGRLLAVAAVAPASLFFSTSGPLPPPWVHVPSSVLRSLSNVPEKVPPMLQHEFGADLKAPQRLDHPRILVGPIVTPSGE
jgi:hypothetical protein